MLCVKNVRPAGTFSLPTYSEEIFFLLTRKCFQNFLPWQECFLSVFFFVSQRLRTPFFNFVMVDQRLSWRISFLM